MISLDQIQVDLTPLYTQINEVKLRVLDLDNSVHSLQRDITDISSQLTKGGFNNFDFTNMNNVSGVAEGLNGYHDTTFKFNCVNCSTVVSNFNSYTNVSGSIYGDGLRFDNCFNNNSGNCNYVLSPEGLNNCFNYNKNLFANIEAYDLNNCLNNDSFKGLYLDVRLLSNCLNNVSNSTNFYVKADYISSALYNFVQNGANAIHVNAFDNVNLMNNCNISFINGYFNGDVAVSCFTKINFIYTSSASRRMFFNYHSMNNCFNSLTFQGEHNIYGEFDQMVDCFKSVSYSATGGDSYKNGISVGLAKNCFMSMSMNNPSAYLSFTINSASSAFKDMTCYNTMNMSLKLDSGRFMFMNIQSGRMNLNLNVGSLYSGFQYITLSQNNANSYVSVSGYITEVNSLFNNENKIGRLILNLNGNYAKDLLYHQYTTQTHDRYSSLTINLNYNTLSNFFVGMRNGVAMNALMHVKGASAYNCLNNINITGGRCHFDVQYASNCCNNLTNSLLYCNGDEFRDAFSAGCNLTSLNINVNSLYNCVINNTVSMLMGDCGYVLECFNTGNISSLTLKGNSLFMCANSLSGNDIYLNAQKMNNVLRSCTYNNVVCSVDSDVAYVCAGCQIHKFDMYVNKFVYAGHLLSENTFSTIGIHSPMNFGIDAFNSNSIESKLVIDEPPVFMAENCWKDVSFGNVNFGIEYPNLIWVGPNSDSLTWAGIKAGNNTISMVWPNFAQSSDMNKYCSNYTTFLLAVLQSFASNVVIKEYCRF